MLIVLVLFYSTMMVFSILTGCYLSKVCTTAYYVTIMMGIQEFMYYHVYSTRAVLQHYDGFLHLDRVLPI